MTEADFSSPPPFHSCPMQPKAWWRDEILQFWEVLCKVLIPPGHGVSP